jgi:WD40 repeat protein
MSDRERTQLGKLPKWSDPPNRKFLIVVAGAVFAVLAVIAVLLNVTGDKPVLVLAGHGGIVTSVAFSPNTSVIASGSTDGSVNLWDPADGRLLLSLTGHSGAVLSVAFAPDGLTLASGGEDQTIRVWHATTGRLLRELTDRAGIISSVAFSPDGHTLAAGRGGSINTVEGRWIANDRKIQTVELWDIARGQLQRTLTSNNTGPINAIVFSPDGRTIAGGDHEREGHLHAINLWDVSSGQLQNDPQFPDAIVGSIAFSPDGRTFASTDWLGGRIVLRDAQSARLLYELNTHFREIDSIIFSPDGRILASSSHSDNTIELWDVAAGKAARTLTSYTVPERPMRKSTKALPISDLFDIDHWVTVFRYIGSRLFRIQIGYPEGFYSVAFSSDGQTLASGSTQGTVKLWSVSSSGTIPR